MGLDQELIKTGFRRDLKYWDRLTERQYFRKFNALHTWVMKNCTCSKGTPDEFGFVGNVFKTLDDNVVNIPIKKCKWKEMLADINAVFSAGNVDLNGDKYDAGQECTEDKKIVSAAKKHFPNSKSSPGYMDYSWSYFANLLTLREAVKEILDSLGPRQFFAGDPKLTKSERDNVDRCRKKLEKLTEEKDKFIKNLIKSYLKNHPDIKDNGWEVWNDKQFQDLYYNETEAWDKEHSFTNDMTPTEMAGVSSKTYARYMYGYWPWY